MKESTGASRAANLAKLPELCYAAVTGEEVLCIIRRGEQGYFHTDFCIGKTDPVKFADEMNERLGVTKAQARAMLNGSMFGWHVPAADPDSALNKKDQS